MQASTLAVRQFEIAQNSNAAAASQVCVCSPDEPARHVLKVATSAWQITVTLYGADEAAVLAAAAAAGRTLAMVVGDVSEVAASPGAAHFTNATILTVDFQNAMITVTTSVTGLPPVFIFRGGTSTTVSSPFIPEAARGLLDPDPAGIADLLRWGHPIDGRTLFAQLNVVLSNFRLELAAGRAAREVPGLAWPTDQFADLGQAEIIRREIDAFSAAAGRLDHRNAFVSLSGGLDSRTSLVGLLSHGHQVPCVTMAGSRSNLDLNLAEAYCRERGLTHTAVFLDEHFDKQVAKLVMESADLTGGVACLSQTVDLHLYNSIGTQLSARVSGNLGNQVGRGGVESLSVYQPVGDVFSHDIRQQLAERPLTPWFIPRLAGGGFAEALFGQEVHFWSIPNYVVGSSRAAQLSPYADLELFSLARAGFALDSELGQPTRAVLRARDIRHRMSGIRTEASFQRQFLAQSDRRGCRVPLNWGWRASGRPSVRGRLAAAASAADAAMTKLAGKPGRLRPVARWASAALGHRSSLVDWRRVLHTQLRDLCMDAIRSHPVRQAAVFDQTRLEGVMREYFDGDDSRQVTVLRALELSLGIVARAGVRS